MDDTPKSHLQNMIELYMTSITITLSIQLSFMLYRKLKGNNDSNKDVDKKRTHVQYHQMVKASTSTSTSTGSSSQASKNGHKSPNPLMRLITRFTGTGNGTEYQELQFNEAEFECRQQVSVEKPETAEAGCQVCQEIIQKRERRNRAHGGGAGAGGSASDGSDDVEANESFTQDIFASEDTSAAAAVEPSEVKHTCAVCLDEDISLGSGNTTMTECGHVFHLTCLLKSLCQKNLCPMCRAPLEDVREKQMPANILTPVSAEQMVAEEISYFSNAAHVQSITSSRHPKRCFKEALRVFGFTLLRSVAEYVHDENMPVGWYDDGDSETESSDDENENEDPDNQDDDQSDQSEEEQYDDDNGNRSDDPDNGNRSDDEFNYAVRRVARVRDLRESIGN